MKHVLGLAISLSIFWLINSGYFHGLLLGLGAISVLLVVLIARRMEVVDHESIPIHISTRLPIYFAWLLWEIIKANIDVIRRIWQPVPQISPVVFWLSGSQQSDLAKVIYANSITMTPGTITLDIQDGMFKVHSLTQNIADELRQGAMDRKVTQLEE